MLKNERVRVILTMNDFYIKYGPWAIVTGASSGIGEEFCRQLADRKLNLILVSRREEKLKSVSDSLISEHGIETKIISLDISEYDFVRKIISVTQNLDVGLLINNAGFALTGNFLNHSIEEEIMLLNVNCKAPVILSHIFGTILKNKGKGGIINIASASAFLPMPGWTNYSASKAYLLHFSEALSYELREKNIDVLALCPASTSTEFSEVAGTKSGGMEVSKLVAAGLNNLGKTSCYIPGFSIRFGLFIFRFLSRKSLVLLGAKAVAGMIK